MRVILSNNDYGTKDIHLVDENKTLSIVFAGTGDLHWIIRNTDCIEAEEYAYDYFEITKENYQIYSLFEELLYDIGTINIFDGEEIKTSSDVKFQKMGERKYNMSHYNDLYDSDDGTVTWVSDETGFEVANMVSIKKREDKFSIEFRTQLYIEGYDREYNTLGMIGVRFRNSGSRYAPFNVIFMRMFRGLQEVDDVSDYGHQMHIEEYVYQKSKVRK